MSVTPLPPLLLVTCGARRGVLQPSYDSRWETTSNYGPLLKPAARGLPGQEGYNNLAANARDLLNEGHLNETCSVWLAWGRALGRGLGPGWACSPGWRCRRRSGRAAAPVRSSSRAPAPTVGSWCRTPWTPPLARTCRLTQWSRHCIWGTWNPLPALGVEHLGPHR